MSFDAWNPNCNHFHQAHPWWCADVRKNWVGNFSRELLEKVPIKITEIKRSQSSGFDLFPLFCVPAEFSLETIYFFLELDLKKTYLLWHYIFGRACSCLVTLILVYSTRSSAASNQMGCTRLDRMFVTQKDLILHETLTIPSFNFLCR